MPAAPNGLDAILTLVTTIVRRRDHVFVIIDKKNREVVRNRLLAPWRETVTYELVVNKRAEIYDNARTIKVFKTNEETDIRFRLSVVAREAQAERIVAALADPDDSPGTKLTKLVAEAIQEEALRTGVRGPDGLATDIAANHGSWTSKIQTWIGEKIGLEAEMIFEFPPIGLSVARRSISIRHHEMRTRDAPERLTSLIFHVTLEPDGTAAHHPLPQGELARATRIRDLLGQWLPHGVTLYQLWFDKPKVEAALVDLLTRALQGTGHRAMSVLLEPVVPPVAREEQIIVSVPWQGRSRRIVPFSIDAILTITEDGAGIFDQKKPLPRRAWLEKEAASALTLAMHGRDFEDLNEKEQDQVGRDVRLLLEAAAKATGQNIRDPLVAKVLLPENVWLSRVRVDIPAERYNTKNVLVDAEFEIMVEIQFETLRPLIDALRMSQPNLGANADFNALIKDRICDIARVAARNTVKQIDDTDYYANFEPWNFYDDDPIVAGTKKPIKDVIREAIITATRGRLGPKYLKVELRRIDSQVGEIIKMITALGSMEVPMEITPADVADHADILRVKVTVRFGSFLADKVAWALGRGTAALKRETIETSIRKASTQFLSQLVGAAIQGLRLNRAGGGETSYLFVAFESYLNTQMVASYGFSVSVEHVEVGEPDRLKADRATGALPAQGQLLLVEFQREEMRRRIESLAAQRTRLAARIEALNADLLANDRRCDDDRTRYRQDSALLEDLSRQYEADGERLNRLLRQSLGSQDKDRDGRPRPGLGHDPDDRPDDGPEDDVL